MLGSNGHPRGSLAFKPFGMDGLGYMCGGGSSDDALTLASNLDVNNSYVMCPSIFGDDEWRELFTALTLAPSEFDPKPAHGSLMVDAAMGGFASLPARSNYRRIMAGWNCFVYRIVLGLDGSIAATRCNRAAKRQFTNNGPSRYWNDKIASHPTDDDIWLFGTSSDGVTYTLDGGDTCLPVNATLPANQLWGANTPPYVVAIGPDGLNCYIVAQGTGVYHSSTGVDGAFALMSGSPTWASALVVDADGTVWVCNPMAAAGSNLFKCVAGSWSVVTGGPARFWLSVAVNPQNAQKVAVGDANGVRSHTTDGFATWRNWQSTFPANGLPLIATDDVPSVASNNMFIGKLWWDPVDQTKIWAAHGTGVAYSSAPPTSFVPWPWYSKTRGIKALCATNGLSRPGKPGVILGCWDKPYWNIPTPEAMLTALPMSATGSTAGIDMGWQFDYAADDLDYLICASGYASDTSGESEDGGASWSELFPGGFPTGQAGGNGGACAMNRKNQRIILPGNNMRGIGTNDGENWAVLPIDPNIGGMGNWIAANYIRRNCVTADKTRDGAFAIIMGSTQGAANHGIWATTTGPLGTWTRKRAGRLDSLGDPSDSWYCRFAYIPGRSGELLYTSGATFPGSRLIHYTDDGASGGTILASATTVTNFSFGLPAPGQAYPAVFFTATIGGLSGLWVTFDFFATAPRLMTRWPANSLDNIGALLGDWNVLGRVWVGRAGSNWICADFVSQLRLT